MPLIPDREPEKAVQTARTENMQAYVDDLQRRFSLHGGYGRYAEDVYINHMIQAVEIPGWYKATDKQSIFYNKQFAREQLEYGRDCVAETKKFPELYNDVDKNGLSIGYICRVIEGGWEYAERYLRLLDSFEAAP